MTTTTPANTALRELLIAAADIQGLGLAPSPDDYVDAYRRYDEAHSRIASEDAYGARRQLPDPGAVLRSLGWAQVDWSPPGSGVYGLLADVQGASYE